MTVSIHRPRLIPGEAITLSEVSVEADGSLRSSTLDGHPVVIPATQNINGRAPSGRFAALVLGFTDDGEAIASRVHHRLPARLLDGLVPEITSGVIRVMRIARLPGIRTKLAVAPTDPDVDPVAACVGRSGHIVSAVSALLGGERIEVIPWSPDPKTMLIRGFAPAKVEDVTFDDATHATVFVAPHMMASAVGEGGVNARLAGRLLGRRRSGDGVYWVKVTVVPAEASDEEQK